ncbi:MAG: hypothetical protein D6725_09670 [Planctomycetota bacterium]|nr:MAG: hypothetical protein D6725_09670 [Planctomycetota bacterium]
MLDSTSVNWSDAATARTADCASPMERLDWEPDPGSSDAHRDGGSPGSAKCGPEPARKAACEVPLRIVGDAVLLQALRLLKSNAYAPVRAVRCRYLGEGRLVLTGTVPSYYLKQMAQTALRPLLEHDIHIENRVHVESG